MPFDFRRDFHIDINAPYGRVLLKSATDSSLLQPPPDLITGDTTPVRFHFWERGASGSLTAADPGENSVIIFSARPKGSPSGSSLLFQAGAFTRISEGVWEADLDLTPAAFSGHLAESPAGAKVITAELEIRDSVTNQRRLSIQFECTGRPEVYENQEAPSNLPQPEGWLAARANPKFQVIQLAQTTLFYQGESPYAYDKDNKAGALVRLNGYGMQLSYAVHPDEAGDVYCFVEGPGVITLDDAPNYTGKMALPRTLMDGEVMLCYWDASIEEWHLGIPEAGRRFVQVLSANLSPTTNLHYGRLIRGNGHNVTLGVPAAADSYDGHLIVEGPTALTVEYSAGYNGPLPLSDVTALTLAAGDFAYCTYDASAEEWHVRVTNRHVNLSGDQTVAGEKTFSNRVLLTGQDLGSPSAALTRANGSLAEIVKGARIRPLRYFGNRINAGAAVSTYGEDAFINMTAATAGAYAEAYFGEFQLPSQPFSGARLGFNAPFLFGFYFGLVSASATSRMRVGIANARSTAPTMADVAPFADNNVNVSIRMNGGVLQVGIEYYAGSYKQSWATLHASHNSNRSYHVVLQNLGNGTYKLWAEPCIDYTSPPATVDLTAPPLITIADGPQGYPPGNSSRASAIVVNNTGVASSTNDRWMVGNFRQEYF